MVTRYEEAAEEVAATAPSYADVTSAGSSQSEKVSLQNSGPRALRSVN